jgi:hypothetical protein
MSKVNQFWAEILIHFANIFYSNNIFINKFYKQPL